MEKYDQIIQAKNILKPKDSPFKYHPRPKLIENDYDQQFQNWQQQKFQNQHDLLSMKQRQLQEQREALDQMRLSMKKDNEILKLAEYKNPNDSYQREQDDKQIIDRYKKNFMPSQFSSPPPPKYHLEQVFPVQENDFAKYREFEPKEDGSKPETRNIFLSQSYLPDSKNLRTVNGDRSAIFGYVKKGLLQPDLLNDFLKQEQKDIKKFSQSQSEKQMQNSEQKARIISYQSAIDTAAMTILDNRLSKIDYEKIKHRNEVDYQNLFLAYAGFSLKWDFITELPIWADKIKINYGFFEKGDALFTYRCTSEQRSDLVYRSTTNHSLTSREKNIKRCSIMQTEVIRSVKLSANTILYLDLWIWKDSSPTTPEIYGWSILEMLDDTGALNSGKFKLPLYSKEYNPYIIFQTGIPYKSEFTFVCVEISQAYDPNQRTSCSLVEQFIIPKLHLQKKKQDVLQELKEKEEFHLQLKKLDDDKQRRAQLFNRSDDQFVWEEVKPEGDYIHNGQIVNKDNPMKPVQFVPGVYTNESLNKELSRVDKQYQYFPKPANQMQINSIGSIPMDGYSSFLSNGGKDNHLLDDIRQINKNQNPQKKQYQQQEHENQKKKQMDILIGEEDGEELSSIVPKEEQENSNQDNYDNNANDDQEGEDNNQQNSMYQQQQLQKKQSNKQKELDNLLTQNDRERIQKSEAEVKSENIDQEIQLSGQGTVHVIKNPQSNCQEGDPRPPQMSDSLLLKGQALFLDEQLKKNNLELFFKFMTLYNLEQYIDPLVLKIRIFILQGQKVITSMKESSKFLLNRASDQLTIEFEKNIFVDYDPQILVSEPFSADAMKMYIDICDSQDNSIGFILHHLLKCKESTLMINDGSFKQRLSLQQYDNILETNVEFEYVNWVIVVCIKNYKSPSAKKASSKLAPIIDPFMRLQMTSMKGIVLKEGQFLYFSAKLREGDKDNLIIDGKEEIEEERSNIIVERFELPSQFTTLSGMKLNITIRELMKRVSRVGEDINLNLEIFTQFPSKKPISIGVAQLKICSQNEQGEWKALSGEVTDVQIILQNQDNKKKQQDQVIPSCNIRVYYSRLNLNSIKSQYSSQRALAIKILSLAGYKDKPNITFDVALFVSDKKLVDNQGGNCQYFHDSWLITKQKGNYEIQTTLLFPLNMDRVRYENNHQLQNVFILFTFESFSHEEQGVFGWMIHPLFKNDKSFTNNFGQFKQQLYQQPVPPHIELISPNISKKQKIPAKFQFEVLDCRLDDKVFLSKL